MICFEIRQTDKLVEMYQKYQNGQKQKISAYTQINE